jgi:hypothetical protein
MTDREPIIVPLGLITQPNKMGVYPPGAMSRADGCALRSPGLLTKLPSFVAYNLTPFTHAEPMVPHLLEPSDSKFLHISRSNVDAHWELSFFDDVNRFGNDLFAAGLPFQPITFDTTGRITATRSRDRWLVNSDDGILIVDSANPTSNATALPRMAGFPPPLLTAVTTTTNAGTLTGNTHCSCKALIRRKSADGYEFVSPPSAACEVLAITVASDISYTVSWPALAQVIAGDLIEVYRTFQQSGPLAATTVNVGAVYKLSTTHAVTGGEAAANNATFVDFTRDNGLGDELYTNPGIMTALGAAYAPPQAKFLGTFKGYTFYGNLTELAQIVLSVPGGIGLIDTAMSGYIRKTAVGRHAFTATFTNTSNILTAISAADIVGLAIGQTITDAALTGGVGTVTAVGGATVTLSVTANTNVTKVTFANDVIELNGGSIQLGSWGTDIAASSIVSFIRSLQLSGQAENVSLSAAELLTTGPGLLAAAPAAFSISRSRFGGGSFTIRASNGQNYLPVLPDMTATAQTVSTKAVPNGIAWSDEQQPEAVTLLARRFVGSGTLYGGVPTRDAFWIFASDGLWRLAGTGGNAGIGYDWRVDPVDSTLSLAGPHAACVLRDTVYAYTNRGLVSINGEGVKELSNETVNDLLPGPPFSATLGIRLSANETDDEIWMGIDPGTGFLDYYIYNTLTKGWTKQLSGSHKVIAYARFLQRMAAMDQLDALAHSTTLFGDATADYQPITSGDPFSLKQWVDMTFVASAADATKSVTPRFNGSAGPARTLTSQGQDARTTWGVGRNTPAVANSLAPGFTHTGTGALTLYGVSLRSVLLTDQRKQR